MTRRCGTSPGTAFTRALYADLARPIAAPQG